MAMRGLQLQVLGTPKTNSGYAWQNHMRRQQGLETTPTTPGAFHQARLRLEQGGTVLPAWIVRNPGSTYKPRFFGHPSALPVFYVRLAINTHVPIYVVAVTAQADGSSYLIDASEPITMEPNSDPHGRKSSKMLKLSCEQVNFLSALTLNNGRCSFRCGRTCW